MSELKAVLLSEDGIILWPQVRNSNFWNEKRSQKLFLHYHPHLCEAGESRMLPIGIELVNRLKPCKRYVYKSDSRKNGLHPWNCAHMYSEFFLNLSKDATQTTLYLWSMKYTMSEFISCNKIGCSTVKKYKNLIKSTLATIPSQIESTGSSSGEHTTPLRMKYAITLPALRGPNSVSLHYYVNYCGISLQLQGKSSQTPNKYHKNPHKQNMKKEVYGMFRVQERRLWFLY